MKKYNDKMISNEDVREYHFAGAGSHPPLTVIASSQAEAEMKRNQIIGTIVIKSGYEGGDEAATPNI